jgi:hypothetical protein
VTRPTDAGPRRGAGPELPVTDDLLIEALHGLEPWRSVGDSIDWEIALFAYDVPAAIEVQGVPVPAGLYTREVTGDGRHVIAHRWTNRAALVELLNDVEHRHFLFEHIAHAEPRFVAAHTDAIHEDAQRTLASIERDERADGRLHDALIRCWHDLARYIDERACIEDAPRGPSTAAYRDDYDFVTAVIDHTDTLLHERDRVLSFDEAEAAGLDGTLRNGSEPHTWASLTPRQRAAAGLDTNAAGRRALPKQ